MNPKIISKKIRQQRSAMNLTQAILANKTGQSLITIKRAESGKHWLNLKHFVEICKELGIKIELK